MTDAHINTIIASHCGWFYEKTVNAMHKAEKTLTQVQFAIYLDMLEVACGDELELSAMLDGTDFVFGLCHATARQRAEAFLRTLNKWKDEYETIQNS